MFQKIWRMFRRLFLKESTLASDKSVTAQQQKSPPPHTVDEEEIRKRLEGLGYIE